MDIQRRSKGKSEPLNPLFLDPFCGAGSTIAAAEAIGYDSVGIEVYPEYFEMAKQAIPKLAALKIDLWGNKTTKKANHANLTRYLNE